MIQRRASVPERGIKHGWIVVLILGLYSLIALAWYAGPLAC